MVQMCQRHIDWVLCNYETEYKKLNSFIKGWLKDLFYVSNMQQWIW